jgi:predicted 3-demethylubiquinone-9 3-methyltransferase (glyoxalase superfamily)
VSVFSARSGSAASKITSVARYDEASARATGMPAGSAMTVSFTLEGQDFVGLNGGPLYQFTEAVSFSIDCKSQEEVDHFWNALVEGGEPSRCGWLKDKYGLSWQVVPSILPELLGDKDAGVARRAMEAMLTMSKLDIAKLLEAARKK